MTTPRYPRAAGLSFRLYRWLLALYPRGFRERFRALMQATFRDAVQEALQRAGPSGLAGLWLRTLTDLVRSAVREHLDALTGRTAADPFANARDGRDNAWIYDPQQPAPAPATSHASLRKSMSTFTQDSRYGLRTLLRRPGFSFIAVLTLALGIGANSALFSVVQSVLLTPLPYRDPQQIAMIWSRWKGFDKTWVSEEEYQNYRATVHSFSDLAIFEQYQANITEGDNPALVPVMRFSPNLMNMLGVAPALGRSFLAEEAPLQGNPANVVMLSWELWQQRFAGDPGVLGRKLSINGEPYEIVGVMPAGFRLPLDYKTDRPTRLWLPHALSVPPGPLPKTGTSHGSYVIGRLRPGVTAAAANAELEQLSARLDEEGYYPPDWHFQAFAVSAADEVAGAMRPALLVLLGAVGLVLLIACANVANLLLVRGEDRRREMAVRSALGANRGRLVRQLLAENLLLSLTGGGAGIALAWAGVAALRYIAPANLARVPETAIDGGVLAFTALLSVATALIFGLLPALQVARANAQAVLREGGRANTAGRARHRVRRMLVAGEVALAVMLAAGAGLMLRSFWKLVDIDPGFHAQNVLTMRLSTPAAFYTDDAAVTSFYSQLLERVRALPGVRSAGLIRVLPIDQEIGDSCVGVDGYTPPPGECPASDWQAASDGYFETMGTRLIEGRFIEAADTHDAPQVMVVNQAFVHRYIADGQAIGKRVTFSFLQNPRPQTIVGVVADMHHNGLTGVVKPAFFRPHAQWAVSTGFPQRSMALVVRTSGNTRAMIPSVRAQIRALDPRLPVSGEQLMQDVLARAVAQPRFTLVLLMVFGGLALSLAVVGIYGVVSYAVAASRQELGIRMALGAAPRSVVWLSLREGLGHALGGVLIGTVGALGATRIMQSIVYNVPTTDPTTYASVALIGLLAAFLASYIPARRASRTDPLVALRTE